jgi:ParB family chromosome partitioning protein
LSAGHARAIVSLKTDKLQKEAAQKIAALGLSVRQAELLCKNLQKAPAPEKPVTLQVDYVSECEKQLSKHLGRGVKLVSGKKKGRVELEYYDSDDLQTLIDALLKVKK